MKVTERIEALRRKMEENGIDYYIVPTADFHQSEYVGEYFKARKYITGFTGSAGTAVIGRDEARLWTDGRYFLQASGQLEGSGVQLMKMGMENVPTINGYLDEVLSEGQVLAFDGRVVSVGEGRGYEKTAERRGARIVYQKDLIDEIWTDRPEMAKEPVFALDLCYTGESVEDKLKRIREAMKKEGASCHILTTLDDICWTLNIRGNDVEFFPLVLSYAMITMEEMILYIDICKVSEEIQESLKAAGVRFLPYGQIYEDVKSLGDAKILLDPARVNYALYNHISANASKVEKVNPEILFKAMKNEVELKNIRIAEIKDSVAHVRFMKWLKENVGKTEITEISASDKLDEFRKEEGNFIRPSFGPISSFGEHGAIIHYSATEESNAKLKPGKLFLTDTGAGFLEGSTDITRTYALGEVPREMKEDFTIVAVSNLSLAEAKFPYGCSGMTLDMLARKPFWDRGKDFRHGTGHGVGYLLNIHEGPCSLRYHVGANVLPAFEEGMIMTDEPGYYVDGSHGIRLENEILVRKGEKNGDGQFMYFETLTFVPFDLDAICPDMMSEHEKSLLNAYHAEVYEKIGPHLSEEDRAWLAEYTRAI